MQLLHCQLTDFHVLCSCKSCLKYVLYYCLCPKVNKIPKGPGHGERRRTTSMDHPDSLPQLVPCFGMRLLLLFTLLFFLPLGQNLFLLTGPCTLSVLLSDSDYSNRNGLIWGVEPRTPLKYVHEYNCISKFISTRQ